MVVEARARDDLGAVRLHEDPAVRLLVVARPDHVDLDLEAEDRPGERHRAAPLAGAGLRRDPRDALLLVEERLGERRVGLVAARRAHALVLVVDVRGRIERLLQPVRPVQGRRPVERVRLAHRIGDLDLPVGADLLEDEAHREQRREVGGPDRLVGPRVERRGRGRPEVGGDVVPGPRDPVLVEDELGPGAADAGHRVAPPVTGLRDAEPSASRRRAINPAVRGAGSRRRARGAGGPPPRWLRNRTTRSASKAVVQPSAAASSAWAVSAASRMPVESVRATVRWGRNGRASAGQPRRASGGARSSAIDASRVAPSTIPSHSARIFRALRRERARAAEPHLEGRAPADALADGVDDGGHPLRRRVAQEAQRDVERVEVDPARVAAVRERADRLDEGPAGVARLAGDRDRDEQAVRGLSHPARSCSAPGRRSARRGRTRGCASPRCRPTSPRAACRC